jgi:hypothetical protein
MCLSACVYLSLSVCVFVCVCARARICIYIQVKMDDSDVINFLLTTEIIPLCLRIMENGSGSDNVLLTCC